MGRTSVDLYAEQEGARLEDVQSFRKYVGGSATNIAFGTARLGVKSAMLTRVGDEHMGRYVRQTLAEGSGEGRGVGCEPGGGGGEGGGGGGARGNGPRIF